MPYFTSNGANVYVDVSGAGPPVLLVHDATLDHRQWMAQQPALAQRHEVFCMDLRAHGRSAAVADGHTFAGWAADVQRALVQIGMDRLHAGFVVGSGLAADAVLQAAIAEPRSVRGVVVAAPVVQGQPVSPAWQELLHGMRSAAREGKLRQALESYRASAAFDGIRDSGDGWQTVLDMHESFSGRWLQSDQPDDAAPSTLQRLESLKTPLLVVRNRNGEARAASSPVAQAAAQAHVVELDGSGDFPNLDRSQAFDAALQDFIEENS